MAKRAQALLCTAIIPATVCVAKLHIRGTIDTSGVWQLIALVDRVEVVLDNTIETTHQQTVVEKKVAWETGVDYDVTIQVWGPARGQSTWIARVNHLGEGTRFDTQ